MCCEIRVSLPQEDKLQYLTATKRRAFRIASENHKKEDVVDYLLKKYHGQKILVIGHYIRQLQHLAQRFKLPLIKGDTPNKKRMELFNLFRNNQVPRLLLSKVGNVAIDIPDASILIQVSGTFGSRQEEAQRLGRILRPKERPALFFTIITRQTQEQEFAHHRQIFLAEQGYSYKIIDFAENAL